MSDYLAFKSPQLKTQFESHLTQPTIRAIVREFGFFCQMESLSIPVITCVHRNLDEENQLNFQVGSDSPHVIDHDNPLCRAIDIRAHDDYYSPEQLQKMMAFIGRFFPRNDGFPTWISHGRGGNFHLHLQFTNL